MDWLTMLRDEVQKTDNQSEVARRLGYSPSLINQVLKGTYRADTSTLEKRVTDLLGRIDCPHLGQPLTGLQCVAYRTAPVPTSDADQLHHWAACQKCHHNPNHKA